MSRPSKTAETPNKSKQTQSDYAKLRKKAEQRSKRLEQAGFKGYHPPKVKDLSPAELAKEKRKLEKWMSKETSTVKGARADLARKEAAAEARRLRHNEQNRAYRARKAAEKGREIRPRPPKQSPEQRRQRKRLYQREYRKRKKAEKQLNSDIQNIYDKDKRAGQALRNLRSGLSKHGVKVKDIEELKLWGRYIDDRKKGMDPLFYEFDQWLEEMAEAAGTPVNGKNDSIELTTEQLYDVLLGFEEWKSDYNAMVEELNRPKQPNEYSYDEFGAMWRGYLNKR